MGSLKNNGFSLIELLIVVALLGILSAIAVPQYQGYQTRAIVNATKTNHERIVSLVQSTFSNCSAGANTVSLGVNTTNCTETASIFATDIETYLENKNIKNPYDSSQDAVLVGLASTNLGTTYLTVSGSIVTITTPASASETLLETIVKE